LEGVPLLFFSCRIKGKRTSSDYDRCSDGVGAFFVVVVVGGGGGGGGGR